MLTRILLLLVAITVVPANVAYFSCSGKAEYDYLISVINNAETDPKHKVEAQLALADLYVNPQVSLSIQDPRSADAIYEQLLLSEFVDYATKMQIKVKLASLFSGVLCMEDAWLDVRRLPRNYIRAVRLYTEVIEDQAAPFHIRAQARYCLGCLFAGSRGDLPLKDLKRAQELFKILVSDGVIKKEAADLYGYAQFELANLLSGVYSDAYRLDAITLYQEIDTDIEQAIQLYGAVMSNSLLDEAIIKIALWRLGQLYLYGPDNVCSYEKGMQCFLELEAKGLSHKEKISIKSSRAQAMAFRKGATQQNVLQAIAIYNELLRMDDLANDVRGKLQTDLANIQAIDCNALPQEPIVEPVVRDVSALISTQEKTHYGMAVAVGAFLGLGCVYYCISNGVF